MQTSPPPEPDDQRRRNWMSIMAKAPAHLADLWSTVGEMPPHVTVRGPEVGLVMVRGRIAGTGAPFALGEMTVTRAAVRLDTGAMGIGYVAGRYPEAARIAALVDALAQDGAWRERLDRILIEPLAAAAESRRRRRLAEAAATRVEFFTVAREAGA